MTKKIDRFTIKFESIGALADFVNAGKDEMGAEMEQQVFSSPAKMDFSEALDRAIKGGHWPEGAKQIKPVEIDLSKIQVHGMSLPRPEASVIGHRPNVAAHLAGSPLSMVRMTPFHQPNRLIRVAVAVGKSYNVNSEKTFNRGNGILSVLNALHAAGFSIELWALWRNSNHGGKEVSVETCIKDSTDSYSPDSIAFALCNDAFQRRLNWAAVGIVNTRDPDNKPVKAIIQDSLGSGRGVDYKDFDLHYDWMDGSQRWTKDGSADKAVGIAEKMLNKNLTTTGL